MRFASREPNARIVPTERMPARSRFLFAVCALALAGLLCGGCGGGSGGDYGGPHPDYAKALAGSPPALAALHKQANDLLDGGASAYEKRIADLRGYPVVVNLWASWCVPCRQEVPELDRFAQRYRRHGISVLGINVQDNSDDALAFLQDYEASYRQLRSIGDERSAAFGSTGVPENFLVDPRGRLALIWRGPVDQSFLEQRVVPIVEGEK
jgi:cytochrome c biogenesis protein CcmG, thiol:disulfide interchange protein DsbE